MGLLGSYAPDFTVVQSPRSSGSLPSGISHGARVKESTPMSRGKRSRISNTDKHSDGLTCDSGMMWLASS